MKVRVHACTYMYIQEYNIHVYVYYVYFRTPKESNNRMAPEIKCTCFVVEKDEVKEGIRREGKGREGKGGVILCVGVSQIREDSR